MLGLLSLAPVALLGFQLVRTSRQGIQAAVLELHTKLAEKTAQQVDESFNATHEKVAFALAALQRQMEWPDKQELLRSLIETHGSIVEISMLDKRGNEVVKVYNPDLSQDAGMHPRAEEQGFQDLQKTGTRTTMLVREGPYPSVVLYYPLSHSVVARVAVSMKRLSERVAAERVGGTGFAVLVDQAGLPLLYDHSRFDQSGFEDFVRWPIVRSAVQAGTVGSSEFTGGGGEWVGAYAPVYSIGGAIVILQSRGEAYLAANRMKNAAGGVIVLVTLLSAVAATVLARRLTTPMFALAKAAEAVSRGDFLAKVEIATGDELQDLAETFNRMTAQLRSYSVLQVDRLVAEQRKTEAILYSISDGILMTDREGRIQLANRRALEIFGLNPLLSIEGKTLYEALPDSPLRDAVVVSAADPKPASFKDVDLASSDKRSFLRITAQPVVSPGRGQGQGVVIAVRDVTLERELDRMKEEFLHYITHDLRNPLSSAMGFLDVLLKGTAGVLNPDQHNMVSSVKRSAMRLMSMVNNILDIAKMEAGRIRLQLKTVSLAGLAGRSISILESMARSKNVALKLDASEEFSIECDPDLMERVFTNLIGNAIKYTPEDGSVTVAIKDEGASLKVCVQDTGEGIPEEYREKIFQKFEQVHGQKKGGTGLGLTIAKFFVESHLGWIWVESELGKGSRFYFTIPKNLCLDKDGAVVVGAKSAAS